MKNCPFCDGELVDTVVACHHCGKFLNVRKNSPYSKAVQESVGGELQSSQELKKVSVLLVIFLVVITGGIYCPVWFLTRRNAINRLESMKKLNFGIFIFALVFFSISLLLAFISGVSKELGEIYTAIGLYAFSLILHLVAGITLLIQCFKVRSIFNDHFNVHLERNIQFSWVATLFFEICYLQYKVNRF
jgi:Ca2+/Na+ antiporter